MFVRVCGYSEAELLGAPHSIIRHPAMPRCGFKFLWDTLAEGKEVFACVVNLAKTGEHYWVLAHVTPTWGPGPPGHRLSLLPPGPGPLGGAGGGRDLRQLLAEEQKYPRSQEGMEAGSKLLGAVLAGAGVTCEEVWSLTTADASA